MEIQTLFDKSPLFKDTLEKMIHKIWLHTVDNAISNCGYCDDLMDILWGDLLPFPTVFYCDGDWDKAKQLCKDIEAELGLDLYEHTEKVDFTDEEAAALKATNDYIIRKVIEKTIENVDEKYPHFREEDWFQENIMYYLNKLDEDDEDDEDF